MKNGLGEVLFVGEIAKECLQFVKRYDDCEIDMSTIATTVEYWYKPHSITTKEEEELLLYLKECDYDPFGMNDSLVVWTMK